ncbi:MAG: hypothetical protein ACKV2U_19325 [Bryobacteraceae bacterium]
MTAGNAAVPFLDFKSFIAEESEAQDPEIGTTVAIRSPFISAYESAEGEGAFDDPVREAYATFVNELHDEEFDEALFELQTDARNMHQDLLASRHSATEAERLVSQHFSQLAGESESMVDAMAREFGSRAESGIVESEIESFVERYSPSVQVNPAFENFFGKLFKKVGKAVKSVAKGIAKLGLGPILNKIKALIRPLLNKVLQKAIGKLPEAVQPAAQKLAEKLGFAAPKPAEPAAADAAAPPEDAGSPVAAAAGGDSASIQKEFDEEIAGAMLARDEVEINMEVARLRNGSAAFAPPVFANLDDARDQFIQDLDNLKPGESPEPHVQNFLPAVLPALKLGMRLIGRPRVINFLSPLLARLISKLIGPEQASALSKAIVDSGLKLLNLEMSDGEKAGLAASAVASTVEETITRVASLPDHILDNQELLEGFALEAFEHAAASNLPAVLSEATYRQRPELLEAGVNAAWVLMPLRGRKRYKRCSRAFKVRITPHMAEEIETFEGVPLSDYLQDRLGLPEGAEIEAEVHLYETLPGTTVADIARAESETPGLGGSDEATFSQLHPLTQEAASALLGKPGLGRKLPFGSDRRNVPAGLRLFHLAIPGRRPLTVPGTSGLRRVRRLFHINVTLDVPKDQIRVCVYISEVKAQRLAVRLRQQSHAGSLTVAFNKFFARRLPRILHGQRPKRLRIVHPGIPPGQTPASVFQKLPGVVPQAFIAKMQEWLVQGFSEFIKTGSQKFLAASEDPADGVTLRFTIERPQGLKDLGQALVEKGPSGSKVAETIGAGGQPNIRVEVFPGHKCD